MNDPEEFEGIEQDEETSLWDPVIEVLDPEEIETTDKLVEHLKEEFQAEYGSIETLPIDETILEQEIRELVEEEFAWFGSDFSNAVNPDVDHLKTYPNSNALRDCLSRLPVEQLDVVFEQFNFSHRPSRRVDHEDRIADHLTSPGTVADLMETRLDEPAYRIVELLVTQPSAFDMPTLLTSNLVDPRTKWTRFQSDTPIGRLRRLGLVHLGIRTLEGDDYVYVGVPEQLQDAISTWLEAHR